MTKRTAAPETIAAQMSSVVRVAEELADMAQMLVDAYADLYDAAYRVPGNPDANKPISGGDFRATDPTGDIATSGLHDRMRWRLRRAAYHFRKVRPHLERAQDQLVEAWAEQDPEFQEKLRRLRQIEAEMEGTG